MEKHTIFTRLLSATFLNETDKINKLKIELSGKTEKELADLRNQIISYCGRSGDDGFINVGNSATDIIEEVLFENGSYLTEVGDAFIKLCEVKFGIDADNRMYKIKFTRKKGIYYGVVESVEGYQDYFQYDEDTKTFNFKGSKAV